MAFTMEANATNTIATETLVMVISLFSNLRNGDNLFEEAPKIMLVLGARLICVQEKYRGLSASLLPHA